METAANIFNNTAQKSQSDVVKSYIDNLDGLVFAFTLTEQTHQAITETFKNDLQEIASLNPNTRWIKPNNIYYISKCNTDGYLSGVLPAAGLRTMASIPHSELDMSLLSYYNEILQYSQQTQQSNPTFKDKTISNLPDIVSAVAFLLEQKNIQEQLAFLLPEETVESSIRYYTFTQEKFTQLLLLCRETNLSQGLAIFEQHAPNIQVTPELLSLLVANSSDAMFEWCTKK